MTFKILGGRFDFFSPRGREGGVRGARKRGGVCFSLKIPGGGGRFSQEWGGG